MKTDERDKKRVSISEIPGNSGELSSCACTALVYMNIYEHVKQLERLSVAIGAAHRTVSYGHISSREGIQKTHAHYSQK